jgi:hypothetical protein
VLLNADSSFAFWGNKSRGSPVNVTSSYELDDRGSIPGTETFLFATTSTLTLGLCLGSERGPGPARKLTLIFTASLYRVIQSCSTILKQTVGEIIWNKACKYNFYRFSTASELRCFHVCVAFIIAIADFHKMETTRRNWVPYSQRKKGVQHLVHFSIATSEYSFLSTFLIVWWGLVRLCVSTVNRVC